MFEKEGKITKPESVRDLAFGMLSYTSSSILGPLIVFIAIGFFLDKYLDTKPIFLIIGVALAFVITNLLIFKKISKLVRKFEKLDDEKNNKS